MRARRLDRLRGHFYRAALLGAVALGWVSSVARAEVVGGVQLPDGAQKVGENRYRAPQGWEDTLKYYKSAYPVQTYPRRGIVNQPGVKAIHIVNPSGKSFEGLNLYEANEEVRIFVVLKDGVKKKAVRGGKKHK